MRILCFSLSVLASLNVTNAGAPSSFQRGHIFVAGSELEACDLGGREWIIEIDPKSGTWSVFADSYADPNICLISGLRFTPDGSQLLAMNFGHYFSDGGWIQAYNPDGTSERLLDESDGLSNPSGANGLVFDSQGDLYVVSGALEILRFPAGGGSPSVFADADDGISFQGALDFAPSGNLYYARRIGGTLQFTPDGESSLFDNMGTRAMTVDRYGNVYTLHTNGVHKFNCEDPSTKHVLTPELGAGGASVIASSGDGELYLAQVGQKVFAIDPTSGDFALIADFGSLPGLPLDLSGIAVFAPQVFGDVDGNGAVDLRDVAMLGECFGWARSTSAFCRCAPADLDGDGAVGLIDWSVLADALTGPMR